MFEKFRRLLWIMTGITIVSVVLFLWAKNLSKSNGERIVFELAPEYEKQLLEKIELKEGW
jgi:hypothetical protein